MKLIKPLLLIFLVFLVAEINVFALPVPVTNASFEDGSRPNSNVNGNYGVGISGWDVTGFAGTWTPATGKFIDGVPDGHSVAFLNNGVSMSQNLNHYVNAGNTLTLEVDVGLRPDVSVSGAFSIEILAGGTQLASTGSELIFLSPGEFQTWNLSYVIDDNDPFLNQPLSIAFRNSGATQINFDNVHFDNDSTTPVPEPATVLLLGVGLAGLAGFRRKPKK